MAHSWCRSGVAARVACLVVVAGCAAWSSAGDLPIPVFRAIGDLPGGINESQAFGVSGNGSIVVGGSRGAFLEAFRWTDASGIRGIGDLPGGTDQSTAYAISADGSTIVGASSGSGGNSFAFRWTEGTGMVSLGDLPGGIAASSAQAASRDGTVIVGRSVSAAGDEAFRWTSAGMQGLGDLPGGPHFSGALGVSHDGDVIVGFGHAAPNLPRATRWTPQDGMLDLGVIPGSSFTRSTANGVSGDGRITVGRCFNFSGPNQTAFRWSEETGMLALPPLPNATYTSAVDASFDGRVIVGYANNDVNERAIMWVDGVAIDLRLFLTQRGVALDGWFLSGALSVSDDGNTIAGYGTFNGTIQGWVVSIPGPGSAVVCLLGAACVRRRPRRGP